MTTRFKVTIRKLSTGCDYHMTLFAKDQDKAMERCFDLARMSDRITKAKLAELNAKGIAVYRVVSCEVDPDQTRPIDNMSQRHAEHEEKVKAIARRAYGAGPD